MDKPVLLYEVRDQIAFITLNRPEKRNALDGALSNALRDAWVRLENDPEARVGILAAAGTDFSVGKDLTPGVHDPNVPFQVHQGYPPSGVTLFKPVVAAAQGYVMGAGYSLAIKNVDITIAAESMKLGFPEARAGIPITPVEYLPYLPFKISLELILLGWKGGRLIDARRAYQLGLVNEVVPDDQLMDEAIRWAELLKRVPPLFIKSVKYGHYQAVRARAKEQEREYLEFVWPQLTSQDRQEAIRAFAEKREPRFEGR